jgi:hypothetical protein
MINILNNQFFKAFIYFIKRTYLIKYEKKILQRGACLSNDALKILFPMLKIENFQKSRVDYLNLQLLNKKVKPNFFDVKLIKQNLYNLYIDQFSNFWNKIIKTDVFIIDSYSELTDQLFVSNLNVNKQFCANFTDVDKNFHKKYHCKGILVENEIESSYELFFKNIRERNKKLKIIYIFFPIQYETRIKFINQNKNIENAIYKLSKKYNLEIISIPDTFLNYKREDDFPYHYNDIVYNYVSNKLKQHIWD